MLFRNCLNYSGNVTLECKNTKSKPGNIIGNKRMKTKGLGQCQSVLYYYKQKLTELSKNFHLKLLRKVFQIQVDFRTCEL